MSQQSEERLPDSPAERARRGARILPFERPQSDLQRAIQQRAQEALDRDRELDQEQRRPKPLKWLVIFAFSSIPVLLLFAGVDSFLRVFYRVMETYTTAPAVIQPAPVQEPHPAQPGVVFLESYDESAGSAPRPAPAGPSEQASPSEPR